MNLHLSVRAIYQCERIYNIPRQLMNIKNE